MHLPLLKITAGIFPHQFDYEISREHLPIMRVAAKIQIDTCICKCLQLLRLVVENDDGLRKSLRPLKSHPSCCGWRWRWK